MIYLYHGSDTYTLLEELKKLKSKFSMVEELSITSELSDADLRSKLQEVLEGQGLFAAKKLVILRNVIDKVSKFPKSDEYLESIIAASQSDLTIAFVQTEDFDARRSFFKKLNQTAKIKEFPVPEGRLLVTWIKKYLEKRDCQIEQGALGKFIELLGEEYDLWQVASELEKLTLYSPSPIRAEMVAKIISRNLSQNVFDLTNSFAEGKTGEATRILERLIGRGPVSELKSQAIQLVGALASQIRSLLLVRELENVETAQAAKILGWKEGRIWVNRKLAKKFSTEKLQQLLEDLRAIDYRLKTSEEPPKLLLALFLQKGHVPVR